MRDSLPILLWILAFMSWTSPDDVSSLVPSYLPAWYIFTVLPVVIAVISTCLVGGSIHEALGALIDPPVVIATSLWSLVTRPVMRRFVRRSFQAGRYLFSLLVGFFFRHVVLYLLRWFLGMLLELFPKEWPNAVFRPGPPPRRSRGAFSSRSRPPAPPSSGAGRPPSSGSPGTPGHPPVGPTSGGDSGSPATPSPAPTSAPSSSAPAAGGSRSPPTPPPPMPGSFPQSPRGPSGTPAAGGPDSPSPASPRPSGAPESSPTTGGGPEPGPDAPAPQRPSDGPEPGPTTQGGPEPGPGAPSSPSRPSDAPSSAPEPIPTATAGSEPGPGVLSDRPQQPAVAPQPIPEAEDTVLGSGRPQRCGGELGQMKRRKLAPFVKREGDAKTSLPVKKVEDPAPAQPAVAPKPAVMSLSPSVRPRVEKLSENSSKLPKVVATSAAAPTATEYVTYSLARRAKARYDFPMEVRSTTVLLDESLQSAEVPNTAPATTATEGNISVARPAETPAVIASAPAVLSTASQDKSKQSVEVPATTEQTSLERPESTSRTTTAKAGKRPIVEASAPIEIAKSRRHRRVAHTSAGNNFSEPRGIAKAVKRQSSVSKPEPKQEVSSAAVSGPVTTKAVEFVIPIDILEAPWFQILGQHDREVILAHLRAGKDISGLRQVAETELSRLNAEQAPQLPVTEAYTSVDFTRAPWFQVLDGSDQTVVLNVACSGNVTTFKTAQQLAEANLSARIAHHFCLPTPAAGDVTLANHASCESLPAVFSEAAWFDQLSSSEKFTVLVAFWEGKDLHPYKMECIQRRRERIATFLNKGRGFPAASSVFTVKPSAAPAAVVPEPVDISMASSRGSSASAPAPAQPSRVPAAAPVSSAAPSSGPTSTPAPAPATPAAAPNNAASPSFSIFGLSVSGPRGSTTPVGQVDSAMVTAPAAGPVPAPQCAFTFGSAKAGTAGNSASPALPPVASRRPKASSSRGKAPAGGRPTRAALTPSQAPVRLEYNVLLDRPAEEAFDISVDWIMRAWTHIKEAEEMVDAASETSVYDSPLLYRGLQETDVIIRHTSAWIAAVGDSFLTHFRRRARNKWFQNLDSKARLSSTDYSLKHLLSFLLTTHKHKMWHPPTDVVVLRLVNNLQKLASDVGFQLEASETEATVQWRSAWLLPETWEDQLARALLG